MLRVGVDVGGTNTDAVLMDGNSVLTTHKSPTTDDIQSGIVAAIREILRHARCAPEAVRAVMIGTTQFTNAFVERRRLSRVGVLRLALPSTVDVPPFADWPADLAELGAETAKLVAGGYEHDGSPISELDEASVAEAARAMHVSGIRTFAISSVFGHVNRAMEDRAADIVRVAAPGARVTVSTDVGRVGLIERENATIMNAMLVEFAGRVVGAFRDSLRVLGIKAPFYVSQNDGTLLRSETAERFPVMTFASGPTNSMRGAAFLTGQKDAVVVDIGGTTTDVGVLRNGFPRESSMSVDIGGVRTNFRMPDILSVGLGGGSLVQRDPLVIGPRSVGHNLVTAARVFGGETLTATDLVVSAGRANIGRRDLVGALDGAFVAAALERINCLVEEAVDRMKTSASPAPVILVGGGAILVTRQLQGAGDQVVPHHSGVVNAVGAAIAQAGAEVDRIVSYSDIGREAALKEVQRAAVQKVIEAGGDRETATLVELEETPLAYMPGGAVRLRARAVAELAGGGRPAAAP